MKLRTLLLWSEFCSAGISREDFEKYLDKDNTLSDNKKKTIREIFYKIDARLTGVE
jgi:hypothetical protein